MLHSKASWLVRNNFSFEIILLKYMNFKQLQSCDSIFHKHE